MKLISIMNKMDNLYHADKFIVNQYHWHDAGM